MLTSWKQDPRERIYFLKADSPSDKKRWLTVLQAVLEPGQADNGKV